jgi:phosphoglycolate phosphatase
VPYTLAIFDFDGTLLDSFAWFTGTIDEVARRYDSRPFHRPRPTPFGL